MDIVSQNVQDIKSLAVPKRLTAVLPYYLMKKDAKQKNEIVKGYQISMDDILSDADDIEDF